MAEFAAEVAEGSGTAETQPSRGGAARRRGEYDYTEAYDELDSYASPGSSSSSWSQSRMNLGNIDGTTWKGRGNAACKKASATSTNHTGRDDRATTEQVMDPRTRMILFKLLSTGFLDEIHGCISTGKEANVYYAKAGAPGYEMMQRAAEAQQGHSTSTDRDPSGSTTSRLRSSRRPSSCSRTATGTSRASTASTRVLQEQPPQDGQDLGREGDAQPEATASCGVRCPFLSSLRTTCSSCGSSARTGGGRPGCVTPAWTSSGSGAATRSAFA